MSDWQPTACILCECNCGIEVRLGGDDGRRFERIRGDKAHPASHGYTCEKALRLDHYQNGRHRLTSPMRRRADGTYEEIDWDTAINEIADRFAVVRDTHGGESIFYYGGGGQGNHLGGSYSTATRGALGSRFRSSALAQEKTGEFWVNAKMLGTHVRGDFEHTEVAVFFGKNPWQSHSLPHARTTLKEIARDPARSLIVVDPRRTETAELADLHLQVRPGTDAWCLAAICAVLVQEDLVASAWLAEHATGLDEVAAVLRQIDVGQFAAIAGVDEHLVRAAARRIAAASSVAVFEDLGVQMSLHSTLVSYLDKLIWLLTGNFAIPGGQYVPSSIVNLAGSGLSGKGSSRTSPVAGARIISGLVPVQRHRRGDPHRPPGPVPGDARGERQPGALARRQPTHARGAAGPRPARRDRRLDDRDRPPRPLRAALLRRSTRNGRRRSSTSTSRRTSSTSVVRCSSRCPARSASQRSMPACARRWAPSPRPTSTRYVRRAERGRAEFAAAFFAATTARPELGRLAPVLLYRALGPTLPGDAAAAAVLWGAAHRCAQTYPESVARAGFGTGLEAGEALFDAIISSPLGSCSRWTNRRCPGLGCALTTARSTWPWRSC